MSQRIKDVIKYTAIALAYQAGKLALGLGGSLAFGFRGYDALVWAIAVVVLYDGVNRVLDRIEHDVAAAEIQRFLNGVLDELDEEDELE